VATTATIASGLTEEAPIAVAVAARRWRATPARAGLLQPDPSYPSQAASPAGAGPGARKPRDLDRGSRTAGHPGGPPAGRGARRQRASRRGGPGSRSPDRTREERTGFRTGLEAHRSRRHDREAGTGSGCFSRPQCCVSTRRLGAVLPFWGRKLTVSSSPCGVCCRSRLGGDADYLAADGSARDR
jgi:hypothetical protein